MITSLPPPDSGADLSYHRLEDQLALLSKVCIFASFQVILFTLVSFGCYTKYEWNGTEKKKSMLLFAFVISTKMSEKGIPLEENYSRFHFIIPNKWHLYAASLK